MLPEKLRSIWSFLAMFAASAFNMNWIWEMVQMPTFTEMMGKSWQETLLPCAKASLGDTAIALAVYGVGALAAGRLDWGRSGTWNVFATVAILGCVSGVAFEWFSLATRRWSYSEHMPIVPILGVGLWPMMQLSVLIPLSLWIAVWVTRRS